MMFSTLCDYKGVTKTLSSTEPQKTVYIQNSTFRHWPQCIWMLWKVSVVTDKHIFRYSVQPRVCLFKNSRIFTVIYYKTVDTQLNLFLSVV